LPSGMCVRYPDLRPDQDEKGRVQWSYADGKDGKRSKLYAGKVTNNCLAEGTLVLTDRGWVPIEHVAHQDLVHDGVEFVRHDGMILNGVQGCVKVDGVFITPEHLVLTDHGWKAASQVQEPYRPDIRHVESAASRNVNRQVMEVALPMRVRESDCEARGGRDERLSARAYTKLRLHDETLDRKEKRYAWNESSSGVRRLAQHAQPLLQTFGSCLQKLRRSGDYGLRTLGKVRAFLGGHGGFVLAGAGVGTEGQQRTVFAAELLLGNDAGAGNESSLHHSVRKYTRTECGFGDRQDHAIQQVALGVADRNADPAALVQKPVYDIVNCGPRHRFVVKGERAVFIVHNCVQGTARCVMTDGMLRIGKRYPVCGTVHDEALCIAPESEADEAKEYLLACMTVQPSYMPGIPLAADGGAHRRYGLAKG